MRITLLTVPGCPGERPARERIAAVLAGRTGEVETAGKESVREVTGEVETVGKETAGEETVEVVTVEVRDEVQARALGMRGSPTILVDGTDPFAVPGAEPSLSCRLYRGADGTADVAPTVEDLRAALTGGRGCGERGGSGRPAGLSALVGGGGQGRRPPADRGLRAVHQAVLRHFAATGRAPGAAALEEPAAAHGRTARDVLADLAREDFLTLDDAGAIRAAYPFSAVPTPHRVRIDGVAAWSMCAIDALGIPAMLGRDVTISSTDPVNGESVTVSSRSGVLTWEPPGAVVFAGAQPGDGPAADVCCRTVSFFTGPRTAQTWSAAHPDVPGEVIGPARAGHVAAETFGPLLED
ncbi:alkylmercury lyase family protein [Streptomyces sp. N35]|uniref:alkylmercury lyase family protein n=1 Tax=Streptomyces sp. N35 TaxID=2795730 RepID=UPI0018F61ECF|nr:alkylmercury lyase family protein [Streptomyces sp. N35]